MNALFSLALLPKPLSFPNLLGSSFFRIIASPLTLICSLLFPKIVLPLPRRLPCARLAAATQAALIAVVDVKRAGRLGYRAATTVVKLHNAPPCFEMPKLKPAERQKKHEVFHSHDVSAAPDVWKAA